MMSTPLRLVRKKNEIRQHFMQDRKMFQEKREAEHYYLGEKDTHFLADPKLRLEARLAREESRSPVITCSKNNSTVVTSLWMIGPIYVYVFFKVHQLINHGIGRNRQVTISGINKTRIRRYASLVSIYKFFKI